jgi:transposase
MTDEALERVARLHADGVSVRDIAAELGTSKSSVSRGLARLRRTGEVSRPVEVSRPAVSRPAGVPLLLLAARRRRTGAGA